LTAALEPETAHAAKQVLHLYDHYVDNGEWDNLDAILAKDFELIGPDGRFDGPEGARRFEQQAGEHLPAHHVLNTILEHAGTDDTIRAWSRYLLVTWEYSARVGDYLDLLRLIDGDWRLQRRQVLPRGGGGAQRPEHASFADWRAIGGDAQ
jgi:hypothetical protein